MSAPTGLERATLLNLIGRDKFWSKGAFKTFQDPKSKLLYADPEHDEAVKGALKNVLDKAYKEDKNLKGLTPPDIGRIVLSPNGPEEIAFDEDNAHMMEISPKAWAGLTPIQINLVELIHKGKEGDINHMVVPGTQSIWELGQSVTKAADMGFTQYTSVSDFAGRLPNPDAKASASRLKLSGKVLKRPSDAWLERIDSGRPDGAKYASMADIVAGWVSQDAKSPRKGPLYISAHSLGGGYDFCLSMQLAMSGFSNGIRSLSYGPLACADAEAKRSMANAGVVSTCKFLKTDFMYGFRGKATLAQNMLHPNTPEQSKSAEEESSQIPAEPPGLVEEYDDTGLVTKPWWEPYAIASHLMDSYVKLEASGRKPNPKTGGKDSKI